MASVILIDSTGTEVSVESVQEYVHRVYNLGWQPKTGTVEDNYNILAAGANDPGVSVHDYVRNLDLNNRGSLAHDALQQHFVPRWAPGEVVEANDLRITSDGRFIIRIASGTTRPLFDATEQAAWTVVSGGTGSGPHTHDEYATDADLAALGLVAATPNTVVRRDAAGRAKVAAPSAADDIARLDTVTDERVANRDRANHTGVQSVSSLSDLTEAVQDIVAAFVVAGVGVTVTHDDAANTFTISATGGGSGGTTDSEVVRDVIGTALVAGTGVQITVNDVGDQITIASTAVLPTRVINTTAPLTGGGDLSADRTLGVSAASTTASGVVELATATETATGTDAGRAVTPAGLKGLIDSKVSKSQFPETVFWDQNGVGTGWGSVRPAGFRWIIWHARDNQNTTDPLTTIGLAGDEWIKPRVV